MPIDFHDEKNRSTYAQREAESTWITHITRLIDVNHKQVLDIGCGGGIYSKALADIGAAHVTGVDFSEQILRAAKENCSTHQNIDFVVGNALDTGLPSEQFEIILERALIHHIQDLTSCFNEAHRLLKEGGTLIVQDRTTEDCLLEGSSTHIRGYFFAKFPELVQTEISRRHTSEKVNAALTEAGFARIEEHQFWEIRKVYPNVNMLTTDLLNRTGRSILHELSEAELAELVQFIIEQVGEQKQQVGEQKQQIVEKDRWTIWKAIK